MRALILAAGLGTRLEPITNNIPKALVEVNKTPILFHQIDNLTENGISDITVIAGYQSSLLKKAVAENYEGIRVVESIDYANTNNMYSAYLGRACVEGKPFLMMNADVYFDSCIVGALLSSEFEDAIAVDVGNYYEESMKVVSENGVLVRISKDVAKEDALGSSIDVYKFSERGGRAFFDKCREFIENRKEKKLWSEVALNEVLRERSILFHACPLNGRWMEIDNHDDLKRAEKIFAGQQI